MRRRPWLGWVLLGALCLTGSGLLWAKLSTHQVAAPGADVGTELDQAVPSTVLDLPFQDSRGRTVRLRQFRGKVVVISDMMTLCQETCPMDTATVVQTARDEDSHGGAASVVYLSVTVDPGRDTSGQLAAYRRLFDKAPANWLLLTGRPAQVAALWRFFGVWTQKVGEGPGAAPRDWRTGAPLTYDVSHSDEVFFLDPHGHERFVLEGPPSLSPALLPRTLRGFLDARGRTDLASPSSSSWDESQARHVLAWLAR